MTLRGDPPPSREEALPAVLIHGFLGEPADWDAVVACLARPRRIYRADLMAAVARVGSLSALASAVAQAIRVAGIAPAHVVGYSLGARVAMTMLVEEPEVVRLVIAVSGTPGMQGEVERRERAEADATLSAALARDGLTPFIEHWYAQPLFASLREHPDYAAIAGRRASGDAATWARVLREASPGISASLWERLPALAGRLALAVGSLDAKYVGLAREAARVAPALQIEYLHGAGHAIHLERPESLAALIDELP